jgi:hypothetical protein
VDLDAIFTADAIRDLAQHSNRSAEIKFRLDVLNSHRIRSSSPAEALALADLEGKRALWQRWLHAASSCGLFVGKDGNDLLSRLRGRDDNGFRSALAECMVCWAFSDDLGLRISPRPQGRDGSVLEFLVQAPSQEMNVEVKSPRNLDELANPDGGAVDVSAPAAALARALDKAAKQFNERIANVLVLAFPETGAPPIPPAVAWEPELSLIPAFFGEHALVTYPSGPTVSEFRPEGKLLKQHAGQPRFTRVSAIICIDDIPPYPKLQTVVLHNPYGTLPVDRGVFRDWRQLAPDSGVMRWTSEAKYRA